MKLIFTIIITMSLCLGLTSCAQNISPCSYHACEVIAPQPVVPGTIVSKRPVVIDATTGLGGFAGVGTGAILGSSIGGCAAYNLLGGIGGAILGGILGNAFEQSMNLHQGIEYIVRLKNGALISVVQPCDIIYANGQHVMVICGYRPRIIADAHWC